MRIHNADIFLAGVALSNVYINKDHLLSIGKSVRDVHHILERRLQHRTKCEPGLEAVTWCVDIRNQEQVDKLRKSFSAYQPITRREPVVACRLDSAVYSDEFLEEDRLHQLARLKEQISDKPWFDTFCIQDIEIQFHEFGNVTITGRVKLRDSALTIAEYQTLSNFSHAFFGAALRKRVCRIVRIYVEVMNQIDSDKDVDLYLLRVPLNIERSTHHENFIADNTLNFAIRDHMIYNTQLFNEPEVVSLFKGVLSGEWELSLQKAIRLSDAVVYTGWTHSLFVMEDYDPLQSENLYIKYKFPLETVTANWGTLDSLSKMLDRARAKFIRDIEEVEAGKSTKRDYDQIAQDIRAFTLKIERIMESLDSYTVSNNPMYYRLIDLQQEAWLESKSVEKIRKKIDLVSKIVEELSNRQKTLETNKLNKALFAITFLTVIEISKVIYDVMTSSKLTILYVSGIFLGLSIVLILIYIGFFSHKSHNRKNQR